MYYKKHLYNILWLICFTKADSCLSTNKKRKLPAYLDAIKGSLTKKSKLQGQVLTKAAEQLDFAKEIQKLREAADQKRGITWKLTGDSLLRDALAVSCHSFYAAEDYVVIIMNSYRAGAKIALLYGEDEGIFKEKAASFMHTYTANAFYTSCDENFWTDQTKILNKEIILLLQERIFPYESLEGINKKLRRAENYVGLDDTHYNVTTQFKIGNKIFGLEDKKWLKLTPDQQEEFKNRQSKNWYRCLDFFEKKLVDAYVPKFLEGRHLIPTQIRSIPGCRNAYQKNVLAYDAKGNATVLGSYYHSATLASLIEDAAASDQIAQHNWAQVNAADRNTIVMVLNNDVELKFGSYNLSEKKIIEQTRYIVNDTNRLMYIPVNTPGMFTTPIFKHQVKELIKDSKAKDTSLAHNTFLEKVKSLEQIADSSDSTNRVKHLINPSNHYAAIGANYIACRAILNQGKKQAYPSVLFNCKSGKDRTGYISYLADAAIIHSIYPTVGQEEIIRQAVAMGAHQQFLSSVNGGMPGRFGMKPVASNFTMKTIGSLTPVRITPIDKKLFPFPALLTIIPLN
ncbi:MAG: tyrosine-protein phosphatase [Candidatus Cardinium sp.]|nr:tyrosine-protein phosphatase [Candidatus Cardinium sp.]